MLIEWLFACSGASAPPQAPPAPAAPTEVAPTPAAPPSPAAEPAKGPCGSFATLLSCSTSGDKVLAVCAVDAGLQYRFGPTGAPELTFPADADAKRFTVEDRTYAQSMATVLAFEQEGYRYEVTDAIGGGGENGAANNFQGVYVSKGDSVIASVACTGELTVDWDAIKARAGRAP